MNSAEQADGLTS